MCLNFILHLYCKKEGWYWKITKWELKHYQILRQFIPIVLLIKYVFRNVTVTTSWYNPSGDEVWFIPSHLWAFSLHEL
jgi:hypothetical protein